MDLNIGGPEVAQAEQEMGEIIAGVEYIRSDGEAIESLGDVPLENEAQIYADNCTS